MSASLRLLMRFLGERPEQKDAGQCEEVRDDGGNKTCVRRQIQIGSDRGENADVAVCIGDAERLQILFALKTLLEPGEAHGEERRHRYAHEDNAGQEWRKRIGGREEENAGKADGYEKEYYG